MSSKVVFLGYGKHAALVIKYLLTKDYTIPCVIIPPNPLENKIDNVKKIIPTAKFIEGGKLRDAELADIISQYKYCAILSCSYTGIIEKEVVKLGVLHLHGGILPRWRGRNLLNWAIIKGCDKSGITLHLLDEKIDTGDIIGIAEYPIYYEDDVNIVKSRMFEKTIDLLDRYWGPFLKGEVKPQKQDHRLAHYYPARREEDGRINWSSNAIDIYNLIRALVEPYPGAFCYFKGRKIIIEKAEVEIDNQPHLRPDKILTLGNGALFRVSTGYNILVVKRVRNTDIMNEIHLKEGDYLE